MQLKWSIYLSRSGLKENSSKPDWRKTMSLIILQIWEQSVISSKSALENLVSPKKISVRVIYPFIFYFFTLFISHFRALPKPTTPPHTTTIFQPYPKSNTTILNKIQPEPKIQTHNKTKHKIVQIITLIQTLNQERVREDIGRNCKTRHVTHGH
jgi:hypothetical protein